MPLDTNDPACRIECRSTYRSGFIEIVPVSGNVTLETWEFDGDMIAPGTDIRGGRFPEEAVGSNTYIEMNPDQARRLIELLTQALAELPI